MSDVVLRFGFGVAESLSLSIPLSVAVALRCRPGICYCMYMHAFSDDPPLPHLRTRSLPEPPMLSEAVVVLLRLSILFHLAESLKSTL